MEDIIFEILTKTDEIFGVSNDPFQIPVTKETWDKMIYLHPESITYKLNDKGKLMGWFGVVPTTIDLMNKFVNGEISENEMFDRTDKQVNPEALYLGGVVVLPEYRNRGIATELLKESIIKFRKINPNIKLFYWAFSEEGKKLAGKIAKDLNLDIFGRKESIKTI